MRYKMVMFLFLAGALSLALLSGRRDSTALAQTAKHVPRVAVLVETLQYGGGQYVAGRYVHAVGSDGSESLSVERKDPAGQSYGTLVKGVLPDGVSYYLRPEKSWRSTVRLPYRPDVHVPSRDPRTGCREGLLHPLLLSTLPTYDQENIDGFDALRAQSIHGQIRLTQWFSLTHGCELIRQTVETFDGDPLKPSSNLISRSIQQLESIIPGEPGLQYFAFRNAEERKPSDLIATGTGCETKEADRLDALYATYGYRLQ